MSGIGKNKISPFLWYAEDAEAAAKFYTSIFPDSKIDRTVVMPADSPSGPEGSVVVVDFQLFGQRFTAMTAGRLDPFNHAISLYVHCDDQAEVDRYWNALLAGGGKEEACGWLKDKYGLSWQIVPKVLDEMMADPNRDKARRATQAMLTMVKLDIAQLTAAFNGK